MLTVWCLWWRDPADPDKYSAYHVQRLKRTISENLINPHRFICVTNEQVEGVDTIPPLVDWPGWWGKLAVPAMGTDANLFLDLDVVITGRLEPLVAPYAYGPLTLPLNWAASGHGGCQSSVMAWGGRIDLMQYFNHEDAHWPPINRPGVYWGDQEFITHLRDTAVLQVQPMPEQWVKSYKYHCRQGLPDDCRVVVFHGEPKPQNVKETWFQW